MPNTPCSFPVQRENRPRESLCISYKDNTIDRRNKFYFSPLSAAREVSGSELKKRLLYKVVKYLNISIIYSF